MLRMYSCCPQFIVSKPQVLFSAIVANLYTGVIVGVHVKASIQNVCLYDLTRPLFSRCLFHGLEGTYQKVIKFRKKRNGIYHL